MLARLFKKRGRSAPALSRGCAHANRHAAAKSRADAPTRARVQNIHDKSEPNLTPRRFRACERARARRRGWEPRALPSRRFQVLLTLSSKFFASFPRGTCALSVFRLVFSFGRNLPPARRRKRRRNPCGPLPPPRQQRMLRAAFSDSPTHEKDDAQDSWSRPTTSTTTKAKPKKKGVWRKKTRTPSNSPPLLPKAKPAAADRRESHERDCHPP